MLKADWEHPSKHLYSALKEDDEGVSVVDRLVGQSPEKETFGGLGEAKKHWVMRMVTISSLGSEYQEVPMPPSQP